MTEKELFEELVKHELAVMEAKLLIKEDCEIAKESGVEKEQIALIKKAAKLHADARFEQNEALVAKYEELTS